MSKPPVTPPRSRSGPSGPTLTEERRAELGQRRLQLRVGERALARLDALCAESGSSRSEQVEALIDAEVELGPQVSSRRAAKPR